MNKTLFAIILCVGIFIEASAQSIKINEFCAVNNNLLDEDKDSPDWFELYNPSSNSVNLLNYSISDDSNNFGKWEFPSVNLNPHETMLVFASGKNRTEMIYYKNIITQGDTFSYSIGTQQIPDNWKTAEFDASGWDKGPSGFGYGDNDDSTLIEGGVLSVFVRKSFQIDDLDEIKELILHVDFDDGFVAYINGNEIARTNLGSPNSDIAYNQTADDYTEPLIVNGNPPVKYDITNFNDFLLQGENILALQVHNYSTGSNDLTLIPFLSVGYNSPVSENTMPEVLEMDNKILHTNFKISSDGERLFLSDADNILIDKTDSIVLPTNISYGRVDDGEDNWFYFSESTPGSLNTTHGYDSIVDQPVTFSPLGGKFNTPVQVALSTATGIEIYYSTDGSVPTVNSNKYVSPINITQPTVIRALVINNSVLSVTSSIETYIIEPRDFKLPIVSLTTDPYNLWDWNYGILVLGPNAEAEEPNYNANFWMDWERPIYFEYFDKQGNSLFKSAAGTKVFGGWSRANDIKSMSLFARSCYEKKSFKYPFFSERDNKSYKSVILRNSGDDWDNTYFRDAMMTGLMREIDIDRQAYQPTIVYLNGTYWGMLNMREKVNENYFANNYNFVDADKVDILEGNAWAGEGSADHYNNMISFIQSNNLSNNSNYDSVCKLMDITNFMDYEIAQIYLDNTDWPGNNIKFWRPQMANGKWRWVLFDTDFGFGIWNAENYKNNTLDFALETNGPNWPNPPWSTFLLRSLLKNNKFKNEFINRFADRLNYNFLTDKVEYLIDSLSSNISDEIPYHNAKWNNIDYFNDNVENMRVFAVNRPQYMRAHINSRFSLSGIVELTVNVSDVKQGTVAVNSLNNLTGFPWTGKYFKDNKVTIKAIANPGYKFSHWEGSNSTLSQLHILIPASGIELKAVFKASNNNYNSIVVNEINYKSASGHDCGDWVELYNSTATNIDISNWILKDSDNNVFKIPMGTVIAKKRYLVVCKNLTKFTEVYPAVTNVIGNIEFGLSGTSDKILLYDKNSLLIDSVLYLKESPWPEINSSQTISLKNPYSDNSKGANWKASVNSGTPGADNDYYVEIPEKAKADRAVAVSCFPNPSQGQTTIRWSCNKLQHVQINIFDIEGRLVETIYDGRCNTGTFEETWYQDNQNNKGIYFIQINFENRLSKTIKLVKI